jgi:tripartite-type tricarboxylate transporter receptor subunit TctC
MWVFAAAVHAQSAKETPAGFFKNHNVEIVVPFSAGGGTDRATRTIAAFWGDFFGGGARINNMPGGGTVVASNFVWKAKPDGLTLYSAPFGTALASKKLFGAPGIQFEVDKFSFVGMYADEPWAFAIGVKLPYKSLKELKKAKRLKLGTTSIMGGPPFGDVTMLHLLGLEDGVVIPGYDSTPEVGLAIKRGEIDGLTFTSNSIRGEADKGNVKPMATVSDRTSPLLKKTKPVSELLDLNAQQRRVLDVYQAGFKAGRVLMGPPGMDPAKLAYLRETMKKMFDSVGYQRLAKKVFGYWDDPVMGEDLEKLV